jgi:hypothetical protein
MHVIPSLIPETVLGTKEPSEKARTAAFEVIVAMGKKMNEGGVVKRNLIDGMDEDGAEDGSSFLFHLSQSTGVFTMSDSHCKHPRVRDHGRWWSGRRQPAHDQRDSNRYFPLGL